MIRLADLVERFEHALKLKYADRLLPGHLRALDAIRRCRSAAQAMMQAQCPDCDHEMLLPHSCGHRACPRCQHLESQRWLERQRRKLLPVTYFMITFTLPAQLRSLAFSHQRLFYDLLFKISWEVLSTFGLNDKQLQGQLGATAVLHTHSRKLDYHPHLHLVVPAGAVNRARKLWRKKRGQYLFKEQNLATVFRAKWLHALKEKDIKVNQTLPESWVVDCQQVGSGDKALTYLAKYLYRGVLAEKDILKVERGEVTFRYTDNEGVNHNRCLPGADFLWLLLQHVLPRGFRRARDYGFLHANSKGLIRLIQLLFHVAVRAQAARSIAAIPCPHCGCPMRIIATGLSANRYRRMTIKKLSVGVA